MDISISIYVLLNSDFSNFFIFIYLYTTYICSYINNCSIFVFTIPYEIFSNALKIFENLLPLKKAVRIVGVSVSSLTVDMNQQILFKDISMHYKLTETVDEINKKYGEWTIKSAEILTAEKFGIKERCGLIGKYLLNKI